MSDGLGREAFERLLAWLDADRERAGERYVRLRGKLVAFFEWRGCDLPDLRADEALDRVARRIAEGERVAVVPERYAYGVARLLAKEALRASERQRRVLEHLPGPAEPPPEAHMDCLDQCLSRLGPAERDLITRYYGGEGGARIRQRRQLAETLGLQGVTLRVRAHRVRLALQACVEACLGRAETDREARPPGSEDA